jgi:hypothetical protein
MKEINERLTLLNARLDEFFSSTSLTIGLAFDIQTRILKLS